MEKEIDLTPSWSAAAPILTHTLEESSNEEHRQTARDEIARMARLADKWAAHVRTNPEAAPGTCRWIACVDRLPQVGKNVAVLRPGNVPGSDRRFGPLDQRDNSPRWINNHMNPPVYWLEVTPPPNPVQGGAE